MNSYAGNGMSTELEMFETPFADNSPLKEAFTAKEADAAYSNFLQELESPFSRTYDLNTNGPVVNQMAEDFVQFMAELHDSEFSEAVYELAGEIEDKWLPKISNEAALGDQFVPFATQQAREYITPLLMETEAMIDQVAQHFSGNNLADHTDREIESFFAELEFSHGTFAPAQEQFFGKIFNKVKSVVKKGVDLAKKGISIVGKILPINIVLNKLKGLIKPFRSSGRFIWPMHYLVLAFGIWGATRIAGRDRREAGTLLLAAVVIVQASDVRFDRWWFARKAEPQISVANFAPLRGHYQHLALAPAQVFGACGDARYPEDYVYRFMLLAHRLGLTFNSGIYARLDVTRVQAACEMQNRAVGTGALDPQTIYVASDSEVERFKAAGVAACGRWDGHWICVSRAGNPRFATYVETGKDPGGP